jgi:hypothetical protein
VLTLKNSPNSKLFINTPFVGEELPLTGFCIVSILKSNRLQKTHPTSPCARLIHPLLGTASNMARQKKSRVNPVQAGFAAALPTEFSP